MTQNPSDLHSVTFSNLVISLASTAMVKLGQVADPETRQVSLDLSGARGAIDMLGVLEEKTRGNLDEEEDKLLTSLLAELRGKFVDASRKAHGEA